MDFWGFESSFAVPRGMGGFFQFAPPAAGGKKGGAGKTDDEPNYRFDHIKPKEASHNDPTQIGTSQDAYVVFKADDPKKKVNAEEFLFNPTKKPPKNTLWSYELQGAYQERDGIAGVTCQEEAEALQASINKITDASVKNGNLANYEPNPHVYLYMPDGFDPNDKSPGYLDVGVTRSSSIDTLVRSGPSAEDNIAKQKGVEKSPPQSADPQARLDDLFKDNDINWDDIRKGRKRGALQAIIAALMAASDLETLGTLLYAMSSDREMSGQVSRDTYLAILKKQSAKNDQINNRIASLLRGKGDKFNGGVEAELQKLQYSLRQGQEFEKLLESQLKDGLERLRESRDTAADLAAQVRRVVSAGSGR